MNGFDMNLQGYLEHSFFLAYITVFVAGLLTSFTPCIYPMIPITVGIIGGQEKTSRFHGFFLALVYVTGIALTYAALGMVASLTGQMFGRISTNQWTQLIVANIIILFGLSMLEVFNLPIPQFLQAGTGTTRRGFLGAFVMGLASGFVAAPCTAPVLAVLLTFVATRKSIFFGSSLLFTFALGMNILLLIIGTFTSIVTAIPRSGIWMVRVKKIMGFLLIVVGEYFLIQAGKVWM